MVGAWKAARKNPFLVAEGLLQIAGVDRPSRKQLGAAAVVGEYLCRQVGGIGTRRK